MRAAFLIHCGLVIIRTSIAENRGVVRTYFRDEVGHDSDLAIFGGAVSIQCEIECVKNETVDLIGPRGEKVSSSTCYKPYPTTDFRIRINESLAFGEYKCKFKDHTIAEKGSTWIFHYRTCNSSERREAEPKYGDSPMQQLFVVDIYDRTCHAVRSCGDRQHIGDYAPLLCPANVNSICHAALNDKYNTALLHLNHGKSCSERESWYISYNGIPIILGSMVMLYNEIRHVKVHCPPAGKIDCYIASAVFVSSVECAGSDVDLVIPDEVFRGTRVTGLSCIYGFLESEVFATMVYAAPGGQNMTCKEVDGGMGKCEFDPRLWDKFEVKKTIKCLPDEQEKELRQTWEFNIASPDECDEYKIVAEVFYHHRGTHDIFRLPLLESAPFRRKSQNNDCNATVNASESIATLAYSCPVCNTTPVDADLCKNITVSPRPTGTSPGKFRPDPKDTGGNSADLLDPGSWCIGMAVWPIVRAMFQML